jgi:hypothetical protein
VYFVVVSIQLLTNIVNLAISLMTVSSYVAFTIGPLLVGGVADLSPLHASLLLPATFGVGVAAGARALPSPAKERAEGPADGRVGAQ